MLETIIAQTREDVAQRMAHRPLAGWRDAVRPSPRSFTAVLRAPHTGFVMECKRASPSEGVLREGYNPAAIARSYAPFADAISVLTDGPFFRGSHDHLRAVRAAVDVPVLCKDFVVDPYQVFEARDAGADAILLMLSVLDDAGYVACARAAAAAGIETLTEVHSEHELDRAIALDAPVIGINNRDLTTLRVDLETVRRLAPRVPRDRVVICESGIRSHEDVRSLRALVDGFLVGTALMRSDDVPHAARELVFGMTKVCGLTRSEDAEAAWEAGATHGGLIFAAESPRAVDEATAERLRRAAPLRWVGVFVNDSPRRIAALAAHLRLAAVQLHGDETAAEVAELRPLLPPGCEVWKAFAVRDEILPLATSGADRVLLDRWHPRVRGGTGEPFDWSLLTDHAGKNRMILSGGLTPEVVPSAESLGVAALDVNSGVEHAPGIKSHDRLAAFFAARRGTAREHRSP